MNREELTAKLLTVDTKRGTREPLVLSRSQRYLHANSGPMNVVAKCRQGMTSTYYNSQYFLDVLLNPPMMMAIVSFEKESSQRHLERTRNFYQSLPEELKAELPMKHDNKSEMSFPSIGSYIWIGTAKSRSFGRGECWHRVLATEYGHWEPHECENMREGIIPSVPLDAGAITIESSPRGEGSDHHLMYLEAKQGKSPFKALFIPWYMCEDYQMPEGHLKAVGDSRWEFEYTLEERALAESCGLTKDQIRWRRSTIAGLRSKEAFLQEFPEDDVSCFRSYASDIFNREELNRLLLQCRPPETIDSMGVQWWMKPQPERAYLITADTSTGWGSDPDSALLLDVTDYPQVLHIASLNGYWRDDEYATKLAYMGTQANNCEIVVERNEVGHSVLNSLINHLHYPVVYYEQDVLTGKYNKPGWGTNVHTKRIMVNEGMKVLESGTFKTFDKDLVHELKMFRHNLDGSFSAPPGEHDDRVMAMLMGCVRASNAPRMTRSKVKRGTRREVFRG